ncbi:hypothetical protein GcM3_024039 [Golovinomyces cichoracearum]|uniref:Uncharacterized protein n=1 Tax=Golovinomyces cichoracearum TaxID=62708 RepID=A0A420J6S8_9PEZI|nr:hypothetical protein GcM3_024039 [Golovinomyces cichoracearum]
MSDKIAEAAEKTVIKISPEVKKAESCKILPVRSNAKIVDISSTKKKSPSQSILRNIVFSKSVGNSTLYSKPPSRPPPPPPV